MATVDILLPAEATSELPAVRKIAPADLKDVLAKGLADFTAMPTHAVFLCLIYPIVGILIGRAAFGYDVIPLLYPLAAGFALRFNTLLVVMAAGIATGLAAGMSFNDIMERFGKFIPAR